MKLVSLFGEKAEGANEDGPPVQHELNLPGGVLLGVADGLGGSGGRIARDASADISHTNAHWASQAACAAVGALSQDPELAAALKQRRLGALLTDRAGEAINRRAQELEQTPSSASGKLLKKLPTTIAATCSHQEDRKTFVDVAWIGDSRVYAFDTALRQLTTDTHPIEQKALHVAAAFDETGLGHDTPMGDHVASADRAWKMFDARYAFTDRPIFLVTATDGVYKVMENPLHLETRLLECLARASSEEDFAAMFREQLESAKCDDYTAAFAFFGSFKDTQAAATKRLKSLKPTLEQYSVQGRRARVWKEYQKSLFGADALPGPPPNVDHDDAPAAPGNTPSAQQGQTPTQRGGRLNIVVMLLLLLAVAQAAAFSAVDRRAHLLERRLQLLDDRAHNRTSRLPPQHWTCALIPCQR